MLDARLGFGKDPSVGLLLVIDPVLPGQCHPVFSFVQATGGAFEPDRLDVSDGFAAIVDANAPRNRLQAIARRFHLNQIETAGGRLRGR